MSEITNTNEPLSDQLDLINFAKTSWFKKKLTNPNSLIQIGTLFSGIGAVEHALKRMKINYEVLFAGDVDKKCRESYFSNYQIKEADWHSDINDFGAKKFKHKVDLLVGGSPCQAFSMVGNRQGLRDPRGSLFYEFARVVKECRPKIFIFENVKGLVNHDQGATWKTMKEVFKNELKYKINFETLNSKHYGIPQNRERIFVVGFRPDYNQPFYFPEKIQLKTTMQDFLEDCVDTKYYLREKGVKFVTRADNRKKRYTQVNGEIALCQKSNQQFNWHGDFIFENINEKIDFDEFVFDINPIDKKYYLSEKVKKYVLSNGTKDFWIENRTDLEIARPILSSMHKLHRAGVDNYITYNRGKIRKLTPRECHRLMGFRDSYKITVSDTAAYQQAGNSIVVDVLIALLKEMDITKFAD